jgi:progressive ankylosis protein
MSTVLDLYDKILNLSTGFIFGAGCITLRNLSDLLYIFLDSPQWNRIGMPLFMREHLTIKTILLFFLPLIFMTELIQISHSITNAFLARLAIPKETLAAFNIAFAFNITTGGITMASTQTGISFITDWRSLHRVFRFIGTIVIVPFVIVEVVSFSPLGDIVFGHWMGASEAVVRQAKVSSAIMGFWTFPIFIRNLSYAMILIRRKTIMITYATLIRVVALVGFLALYSRWFNGALVGAMATVSAMSIESVFMVIAARPFFKELDRTAWSTTGYSDYWRFSWPLMLTQVTENGVLFAVNAFLGRLVNPDLALASFGVVHGLIRVILAPLRNLVQTAQSLISHRDDLKVMFRFTAGLLLLYVGIIFALFYTSIQNWALGGVMGLTPELYRYCLPAVKLTYTIAVFWATAALLRGILIAMRKTGAIAVTAGIRLLVVVLIGSTTFFKPDVNGAVLGVLAIAGAFAAETFILGWRLWKQTKMPDPLFPDRSSSS